MANFRQKQMTEKISKMEERINRLPQPLPEKFLKQYEQKILAYAPLISRVKLCEITPLNYYTLRNLDHKLSGIRNPHKDPFNGQVCYEVEEVIAFLRSIYCEQPRQKIEQAQKELEKLKQEQSKSIYPEGFSYK